MGYGGPVALNMLAVEQGMKDHNVDPSERIDFSLKVRRIANIIISAQAEEARVKAEQDRKNKR